MNSFKNFWVVFLVLAFLVLYPRGAGAVEVSLLDNGKEIGTVTIKNEPDMQLISVASLFRALGLEIKKSDNNGLFARDKNGRSVSFFDGTNVVRSLGEFIIAKKPLKYEKPYLWCDTQTAFNACQKFLKANGRNVSLALKGSGQQPLGFIRDEKKPITITVESTKKSPSLDELMKKIEPTNKKPETKKITLTKPQQIISSAAAEQMNYGEINQVISTIIPVTTKATATVATYQPASATTVSYTTSQPKLALASTTQKSMSHVSTAAMTTAKQQSTTTQKLVTAPEPKAPNELSHTAKQEEQKSSIIRIPKTTQTQPAKTKVQVTQPDTLTSAKIQPANVATKKPLVVLDAGHGGHDPGAMANNVKEKDIVLKAVLELAEILRNQGIDVHLTRSSDVYLKLSERTAIANKCNADVFVSLHCNSLAKKNSSVSGLEYYIMALPRDKDSMALAIAENKELAGGVSQNNAAATAITDKKTKVLLQILGDMQQNDKIDESTTFAEYLYNASLASGLKMRKVVQAPFFVLRGAAMPAVLAELGYLTNKEEAQKLTTVAYRQKLCNTIASGIINYLREHPTITE